MFRSKGEGHDSVLFKVERATVEPGARHYLTCYDPGRPLWLHCRLAQPGGGLLSSEPPAHPTHPLTGMGLGTAGMVGGAPGGGFRCLSFAGVSVCSDTRRDV